MSETPPPEVQAAANIVNAWLAKVEGRRSAEEIQRMTPAQRLDYARSFPQHQMPEWRDPRAVR
jgi:hypothetical protein